MAAKKRSSARASAVNREPYGDPIWRAIEGGDLARMQRLQATSEKWVADNTAKISEVKKALGALRRAIRKLQ